MPRTLIAVLIIGLFVGCTGLKEASKKSTACEYTHDQKMWALATIGIITEMNGDSHVLLGGCEKTDKNIIRVKEKLLKNWWGINSRKDLLKTLKWLEETGHRKRMYDEGKALNQFSEAEFIGILNKYKSNEQLTQHLVVTHWVYRTYGKKSIIAWDYCRYIALCGWGYVANYLSEEEAWAYIMPKAINLQNSFTSWNAMANNYLHGRSYWSWQQTAGSHWPGQKAWERLGWEDSDSPWKKYDWNMDLSCKGSES